MRCAQEQLASISSEAKYERAQHERLQRDNERHFLSLKKLGESIASHQEREKRYDERLASLTERNSALEASSEALARSRRELQSKLEDTESELAAIRRQLEARSGELATNVEARKGAETRLAAMEADARKHGENRSQLEADAQAIEARDRLVGQLRESEQRERELRASLQRCHSERERARERLADIPQVLRAMQSRLTDSLLMLIEELMSVEPPAAAAYSRGSVAIGVETSRHMCGQEQTRLCAREELRTRLIRPRGR